MAATTGAPSRWMRRSWSCARHEVRRAEVAALRAQQLRDEARARADAGGVRAARQSAKRGAGIARGGHEREGLDLRFCRGGAAGGRAAHRALYLASSIALLRSEEHTSELQ